jgi:hypothetical protein
MARIAPIAVVITTTHPAIIATVLPPSHDGSDSVPPIIPKPTASETITPVSQATKVSTVPPDLFAGIFHLLYLIMLCLQVMNLPLNMFRDFILTL